MLFLDDSNQFCYNFRMRCRYIMVFVNIFSQVVEMRRTFDDN